MFPKPKTLTFSKLESLTVTGTILLSSSTEIEVEKVMHAAVKLIRFLYKKRVYLYQSYWFDSIILTFRIV